MAKVIAVANQKGGVGKTTTAVSLGTSLAEMGKRVLIADMDSQANLTMALGIDNPDELEITMSEIFEEYIKNGEIIPKETFIRRSEGVDFIASNVQLAQVEIKIINVMCREYILKNILESIKRDYDFILIDCMPSLGMLTVNALAAADNVLVPIGADDYFSAKGLEALLETISKVRLRINRKLQLEGILITKLDRRTNFSKEIYNKVNDSYGGHIKIFNSKIPTSIRAAESSSHGISILTYDPKGKVAGEYKNLARELTANAQS